MVSKDFITSAVIILLLILHWSGRPARDERRKQQWRLLWNKISRWLFIFNKQKREGYESYSKCIKQGYPNKFCLNVPVEACIDNCNFKKWKPKY